MTSEGPLFFMFVGVFVPRCRRSATALPRKSGSFNTVNCRLQGGPEVWGTPEVLIEVTLPFVNNLNKFSFNKDLMEQMVVFIFFPFISKRAKLYFFIHVLFEILCNYCTDPHTNLLIYILLLFIIKFKIKLNSCHW